MCEPPAIFPLGSQPADYEERTQTDRRSLLDSQLHSSLLQVLPYLYIILLRQQDESFEHRRFFYCGGEPHTNVSESPRQYTCVLSNLFLVTMTSVSFSYLIFVQAEKALFFSLFLGLVP